MKVARISVAAAIASVLVAGPALADRTLWLETDEGTLEVPLKLDENLSVLPSGDISAVASEEFVCSSEPEGPDCEDVQVSLTNSHSFLTVSPGSVNQGDNITISWRARGAWECVGSGLPGTTWNSGSARVPAGSVNVSTSPLDADTEYTVALECSNGPVSATRTASLSVADANGGDNGGDNGGPESCSDDSPTLGNFGDWSRATDVGGSGNPNIYTNVFPGDEFPGTSNNFPFYLERNRYVAMRFTVPETLVDRRGGWTVAPITSDTSVSGAGRMFATITRCPGDFNVENFEDKTCAGISTTSEGAIGTRWTTDPNDPDPFDRYCFIERGETYYLNVLYTYPDANVETFPPEQSDCGGRPKCGNYLQRAFFN